MKKKVHTLLSVAIVLMLLAALPAQAFAAEPVNLELPVETVVTGGFPQNPDTFTVKLSAVTEAAPMPEGSADGVFTMQLTGNDKKTIAVSYPQLGIYKYTLEEEKGSAPYCNYDPTVYEIEVSVTNAESEDGIIINVAINRRGETEKCKDIVFTNKYDYPPSDKPKTGDESGIAAFAGLFMLSGAAALYAVYALRKKSNRT